MSSDLTLLKGVYIYIYTHAVYPLACKRHRWFRMLDVNSDFCVAQHFSLAQTARLADTKYDQGTGCAWA